MHTTFHQPLQIVRENLHNCHTFLWLYLSYTLHKFLWGLQSYLLQSGGVGYLFLSQQAHPEYLDLQSLHCFRTYFPPGDSNYLLLQSCQVYTWLSQDIFQAAYALLHTSVFFSLQLLRLHQTHFEMHLTVPSVFDFLLIQNKFRTKVSSIKLIQAGLKEFAFSYRFS